MSLAAPRVPPGAAEQDGDPLGHALVETAAAVAQANEADEIRTALSRGVDLLRRADPALRYALCEINAGPDGRPVIVWQASGDDFGIVEGEQFRSWFTRARRGPGEFESVRGEDGAGVLLPAGATSGWESFAGLFVSDEMGIEGRGAKLVDLTRIAAAAIARIQRRQAENLMQRRLQSTNADALSWLELGVDIVWEASGDGVLHCRRVLNRRHDLALLVEGLHLDALTVGGGGRSLFDLLRAEGSVRHLRVSHPDGRNADPAIYVSGLRKEAEDGFGGPVFVGTLTAVHALGRSSSDETASVMTQMQSSRRREEELRVEAEAMLEGLRLLLASSTSRDKLGHLTELLARGLRAGSAFIVEAGFDGRARQLVPETKVLDHGTVTATLARDLEARTLKVYDANDAAGEGLRHAFDLDGADVAALALPLKSQMTYFICGTRAAGGFTAASLAFADRFALLLRQALLLREEQAQLAQTAKMAALGQMSASIAHELKQPLNTISLAAQNLEALLSSPKFEPAAAEAKIARMMAQVDRASNVIDRMRRFGRKSVGDTEAVDLKELAEGVVSMMRHVVERAGVEVEIDVAAGLAAHIDGLQVEQVLTNLIQNSVDAISGVGTGSAGRHDGCVRILGFSDPEAARQVVLKVEDNGPGFPDGVIQRALEPFFTTKPAEQGTGLGLAICDAILRESGGFIELGNHAKGGFVALHLPSATKPS